MAKQPPLEQRLVFVQFVRRQRCRYNASLAGFFQLPPTIQRTVLGKWQKRNKRLTLNSVSTEVSTRPVRRRKS